MQRRTLFTHFALILITIVGARLTVAGQAPNIIFIYADDMGWTGTSVEMIKSDPASKSDFYQTPNLQKLAGGGIVFSQAYSPGPMCTPSRAGVLTGLTPAKLHITAPGGRPDYSRKLLSPRSSTQLSSDLPTIGTTLKSAGYATALLGKWHIGRHGDAGDHGFDLHDGTTLNESRGTDEDPKSIVSLTKRGIAFIEKNVKAKNPFYLQLSHYAVHAPIQSKPISIKKFAASPAGKLHNDSSYAGMTWDLDASLLRIQAAIKKLGIANHTYLVFMSDNGAQGNRRRQNNHPLNAGKGTVREGGIRIPFIVTGPGIEPGYCDTPVSGTDLFATFTAWAGAEASSAESENLTALLTGRSTKFKRRKPLLFHYPHYGRGVQKPQTAIILNNWKLYRDWESGKDTLFDLKKDIGESTDLSAKHPEIFKKLVAAMDTRLKETGAQLPTKNGAYNPNSRPTRRPKRRR